MLYEGHEIFTLLAEGDVEDIVLKIVIKLGLRGALQLRDGEIFHRMKD
jgi:hypothetical protein